MEELEYPAFGTTRFGKYITANRNRDLKANSFVTSFVMSSIRCSLPAGLILEIGMQ